MSEVISRNIDNTEILVRFLFQKDFKKNAVDVSNIIEKDIFTDTHNKGVSLQRERYINERKCKDIAKKMNKTFVGFIVFKKADFEEKVLECRVLRGNFEAEIHATPLDENLDLIPDDVEVTADTPKLPAHADIIYLDPAHLPNDDSSPHTFKRIFSKNLFKSSKLLLDSNIESDDFNLVFSEALA